MTQKGKARRHRRERRDVAEGKGEMTPSVNRNCMTLKKIGEIKEKAKWGKGESVGHP